MSSLPKDELSLTNDGRAKLFVTSIEKVTKQLESATEWHDFIPNLKKLKKVKAQRKKRRRTFVRS